MDAVELRGMLGEPAPLVQTKGRALDELPGQVVQAVGDLRLRRDGPPRRRVNDTFRVNGRGRIVDDPELLADSAVEGRAPRLGIVVDYERARAERYRCRDGFY
jgi:hypothetical protein